MARCRWCKRPFRPRPGGRPALFCKPACRQRAYEKRKWTPYSETDALALDLLPAAALRRLVARVRHQHMVELLKSGAVPLVDPAQIDGVLDSMAKPQDRRAVAPHAAAEQVSRRLVRNLVLLGRCGAGRRPPGRRSGVGVGPVPVRLGLVPPVRRHPPAAPPPWGYATAPCVLSQ